MKRTKSLNSKKYYDLTIGVNSKKIIGGYFVLEVNSGSEDLYSIVDDLRRSGFIFTQNIKK